MIFFLVDQINALILLGLLSVVKLYVFLYCEPTSISKDQGYIYFDLSRGKSRINLSIRQLEEDPLLETLDKVIPQDGGESGSIEPLPGLETILEELLQEDGYVSINIL